MSVFYATIFRRLDTAIYVYDNFKCRTHSEATLSLASFSLFRKRLQVHFHFHALLWPTMFLHLPTTFLFVLSKAYGNFCWPKDKSRFSPAGANKWSVSGHSRSITSNHVWLQSKRGPQNGTPGGTEKKVPPKLQKQKSFTVTTVYTPPSNPSKAMQKLRWKTRAAKAFKNTLSVSKTLPIS